MEQTFKINWYLMGAEFAKESDENQAEFFKGLANEIMSWPTHSVREMQFAHVNRRLSKLSKGTIDILKEYLPMVYFEEETTR